MKNKQSKGIDANSRQFSEYDQVEKNQNYRLADSNFQDQYDNAFEIKTCDMSSLLQGKDGAEVEFSQKLGSAMEEIGFAVITGHGIDTQLYQTAEEKIIEFFDPKYADLRQPYLAKRHGSVNQGYFPIKETTIIHPDLVEGWVFCRRAFNMNDDPNYQEKIFWPRANFEPFFRELCLAHEKLILPIMQSILRYLKCEPNSFDRKLTQTNFGFRLNYYPSLDESDLESGAGRMLGHEDVDLFTLLPAQDLDGLQVLNRRNMKWIKLKPPQGSIVVNTGDYMQRITNDRLPSTTHRVSIPVKKQKQKKARVSFPMAVYLWENEMLTGLPELGQAKYPPINAEEFHTKTTSKYYGKSYSNKNKSKT